VPALRQKLHLSSCADFRGQLSQPLLRDGVQLGDPGTSWQSVRIEVPLVDPLVPINDQLEALDKVFQAARDLYDFFIQNEQALLSVRTFK
jgi:hypothetical protein